MGLTGDNQARITYDEWATAMGGVDAGGRVLPRWEFLTPVEKAAWEHVTDKSWADASAASARMNSPTAGLYGDPASATAGIYSGPASAGYASAVPSMHP